MLGGGKYFNPWSHSKSHIALMQISVKQGMLFDTGLRESVKEQDQAQTSRSAKPGLFKDNDVGKSSTVQAKTDLVSRVTNRWFDCVEIRVGKSHSPPHFAHPVQCKNRIHAAQSLLCTQHAGLSRAASVMTCKEALKQSRSNISTAASYCWQRTSHSIQAALWVEHHPSRTNKSE